MRNTRNMFLEGYLDAMLWANTMRENELGEWETFDARGSELAEGVREQAHADCEAILAEVEDRTDFGAYLFDFGHYTAGIDFALSRNGHGAGYFDRGEGFPELQKLAKRHGEASFLLSNGEVEILA